MNVTYNWLKEFVDFDLSPEQLADLMTMLGLEVEAMVMTGDGLDDVIVARVEEKRQHPNADKLSLCRVNTGTETVDVVCGAQNFKAGDTVVLAQLGATLPGDFKIKKSKIRGEDSCGMLCSEKELGLTAESAGILVLPPDCAALGTPIFGALGLKDTLFEVGLTPNRADCLSAVGIAREIAAKTGLPLRMPASELVESGEAVDSCIAVTIEDPERCPRYAARYISGCRIAPSPEWLVKRLNAIGIRSINNVVDVTNFVMMELGQPLHAFDCAQLAGSRIIVRSAGDGELFTSLDSQQRVLTSSDLVICDAERPVALAGIMGGLNSEIEESTTSILLESACFNAAAIRKTSKRLGLHTESSHRFERGIDIEGVVTALDRAAGLIVALAGGTVANGRLDVYPGKTELCAINFRPERANTLIGIDLPCTEMVDIFKRLECQVSEAGDGVLHVIPPTYRIDLEREIDLVEEIARLNGFDKIPATMPIGRIASERPSRHQLIQKKVRNLLVDMGMNEVINFSFTDAGAAEKLMLSPDDPRRSAIKVLNPLVDEQSVMRTSLLPGLLETTARNINFRSLDLKLFEMRRIYLPAAGEEMPHEPIAVAGALTGSRDGDGWSRPNELVDFYDAKGMVEALLEALEIGGISWATDTIEPFYHPGKACSIMAGRERIGSVGEIHPTVLERFGIDKPVFCFKLDFEKLVRVAGSKTTISAPSRFPDSTRDIAILVPNELSSDKVLACIRGAKAKELEQVQIFDVYRGAGIPNGYASLGIRIRYRSYERTLTEDEISTLHKKITDNLVNKLKVTLR